MTDVCKFRRQLIRGVGVGVVMAGLPGVAKASRQNPAIVSKALNFYNRHTGERCHSQFWGEGQYVQQGLLQLDHVLRDHRADETAPMDKGLYELLYRLTDKLDFNKEIHVISGYRSLKTNTMLAGRSKGVAKKSYHTRAMAVDIALPGIPLERVRNAALDLRLGGVGYYPKSGFVHVDTGPVRRW